MLDRIPYSWLDRVLLGDYESLRKASEVAWG